MGCADKLVFSWGGNPGVGSLHRFRDAVRERLAARRSRSRSTPTPPWPMPTRPARPGCRARSSAATSASTCRRSTATSSTSPARSPANSSPRCRRSGPDVAVIHALKADRDGNVLLEGIVGVQKEAVLAAKRSIVTVEEIVDDFGAAQRQRGDPAELDGRRDRVRAGRRASLLCARLLQARQCLSTRPGTRSRATATRSSPG